MAALTAVSATSGGCHVPCAHGARRENVLVAVFEALWKDIEISVYFWKMVEIGTPW